MGGLGEWLWRVLTMMIPCLSFDVEPNYYCDVHTSESLSSWREGRVDRADRAIVHASE
jgi:hypothetical protein